MPSPADVELDVAIEPQPDDRTCGPTCLHALYRYYGDEQPLAEIIGETHMLDSGGTLDVFLAIHALRRGYRATLYTYNLQMFDPTWFSRPGVDIAERLARQREHKHDARLLAATPGYLDFLALGGELRFEDLTPALLRGILQRRTPILTGLSATWLYRHPREWGPDDADDDVRGEPAGHFVLLSGYRSGEREIVVDDPFHANPFDPARRYAVGIHRVIGSILLGIVTYDANLLVIQPPRPERRR